MRMMLVFIGLVLGPSECARGEDIVLGMSAAFTGPSQGLGIELYRGSMAYFEHINSLGGIHGHKIVIKAYDDGYNPGPAIQNTIRLIEKDNVLALFNYVGTPTTTRCLPLLSRHREQSVLLFFPFTGAEPQRRAPYDQYVYNLRASYYQETAGLVDHFVQIGRKRVGVFYQIDAYGRNGWEGVRAALARHDLPICGEATYRRGTPFTSSMAQQVSILHAVKADAVISIGSYAACAAFIREARAAGWEVPIANVSFVGSENMLELLRQSSRADGIDYTSNLINTQVVPCYHDLSLPAVSEYRLLMLRHQPLPPKELLREEYRPRAYSFVSLEGFLNAKLMAAILTNMGPTLERARLRSAIQGLTELDLGFGARSLSAGDRHQASDRVYYTVVHDDRFEPLEDWTRWCK